MKKSTVNRYLLHILGLLLLAIFWQALSLYIGEDRMVFPGPVSTIRQMILLLGREYTYRCILATMSKMLAAYLIALFLGILLGVLAGNYPFIYELLSPFMTIIKAIPTASLIYLFIVLSGFRKAPMMLVILICFPIIYEAAFAGIHNIPQTIINASRLDGAGILKENLRIRIPLAAPYLLAGMASSFSLSFKIEIMAEVITGSSYPGLGSAIAGMRSSDPTNMVPIFAYSMLAVGIMLIIDLLVSRIKEKLQ